MTDDDCVFAHLRHSNNGQHKPLNARHHLPLTTTCSGIGVFAHLRTPSLQSHIWCVSWFQNILSVFSVSSVVKTIPVIEEPKRVYL